MSAGRLWYMPIMAITFASRPRRRKNCRPKPIPLADSVRYRRPGNPANFLRTLELRTLAKARSSAFIS
jgi:hypothetical protein